MKLTQQITNTLLQLLKEHGGSIEIRRNTLASQIGCVPSQINYVITSRFTKEQGYIVESQRGGGGFVRIVKVDSPRLGMIMHVINSIGEEIDEASARVMIQTLALNGQLSEMESKLILSVVPESNFKGLLEGERKRIRANLVKSMLIHIL